MKHYLPITREQLANAERFIPEEMKAPGWEQRLQKERIDSYEQLAEFRAVEAPILAELRAIGLPMITIGISYEVEPFAPFGKEAVEIFLKWLSVPHPDVHRSLVGCLQRAKGRFNGEAVARAFDATDISSQRTELAALIAQKSPTGIDDWLQLRLEQGSDGFSKGLLLSAAVKRFGYDDCREYVWKLFIELPELMKRLLTKYGDDRDAEFLESRGEEFSNKEKIGFKKAAEKIRQRVAKKRS